MMIYEGKSGRRKYLLLPKKKFTQAEAVKFASQFWHCKSSEVILGGAKRKKKDEFYVEQPFDVGTHWCLHRGCKTDSEYLVKWLKGSHEVAKKGE